MADLSGPLTKLGIDGFVDIPGASDVSTFAPRADSCTERVVSVLKIPANDRK